MSWGTVSIGGFQMREETGARQETGGGLRIFGQEARPPRSRAQVEAAQANLAGIGGRELPVTFTDKAELSGFYRVTSVSADTEKWANGAVHAVNWEVGLARIGNSADTEVESRIPFIGRLTDHAVTPNFWHAPAVGARGYYTGATVPSAVVQRAGATGSVPVHLGVPSATVPRWLTTATDYLDGSASLGFAGLRHISRDTPDLAAWEMSNDLVRVQPGSNGQVIVSCWDSGAWRSARSWEFSASGSLTSQPELSILRNEPEEVALRLAYPGTPGRTTVDLALRRGSRTVTGVIKRHSAATLGVKEMSADAATAVTGGLRASAADADGNFFVAGSARTATVDAAGGGLTKAAVTRMDFFIGHEVGPTAQTGDAFADLLAQYLGNTGERVRFLRRGDS